MTGPDGTSDPGRAVGRTAVIGDVGGHTEDLRRELARLGADPDTGRLPDDLTVIQVGDLIHRGPDSVGVVELVDGYLRQQPEQWIQLVGNHEAQYLRAPAFDWPERLGGPVVETLRRWWADGQMLAAASVAGHDENFLVTHAGLTHGFWHAVLDRLVHADRVAAALNSLIGSHEDVLFNAGQMLGRRKPDPMAGPVWAAAATELVPSWIGSRMPFSQIHGHASIYDWQQQRFRGPKEVTRLTTVDEEAKHETSTLEGGRIIGIDPGHSGQAQVSWRAWMIETAR
ncbi:MAG: metallophosphoesterase [Propionibacteriaceae bacterium]